MADTPCRPRPGRFAGLTLIAATALVLNGCGTPADHNPATPATPASPTRLTAPPAPPPTRGADHVEGVIRSVADNRIRLTQRDRSAATVAFTASTHIIETTPARLADVTVGRCATVRPAAQDTPAGAAIIARSVTVSAPTGGRCPSPPAASAPTEKPDISGMVAAVSDTAITLAHPEADGTSTPTAVSVTTTTSFTKQTPAPAQAIVAGKCLAAQGAKVNSGVLQATAIELQPCPPLGGHRHHIPHYRRG